MLPRKNRLRKEKEFKRVLSRGRGCKGSFLFVKVLENRTDKPRFGFIVSKKVSNKAVVRNKVKRRMREAVRGFVPEIEKGMDVVIIAFPQIKGRSFEAIKNEVEFLFENLTLIES